jgi:hypothetical protein
MAACTARSYSAAICVSTADCRAFQLSGNFSCSTARPRRQQMLHDGWLLSVLPAGSSCGIRVAQSDGGAIHPTSCTPLTGKEHVCTTPIAIALSCPRQLIVVVHDVPSLLRISFFGFHAARHVFATPQIRHYPKLSLSSPNHPPSLRLRSMCYRAACLLFFIFVLANLSQICGLSFTAEVAQSFVGPFISALSRLSREGSD